MLAAVGDGRRIVPETDVLLDITLFVQIGLLAYILAIWDMPVQHFPALLF